MRRCGLGLLAVMAAGMGMVGLVGCSSTSPPSRVAEGTVGGRSYWVDGYSTCRENVNGGKVAISATVGDDVPDGQRTWMAFFARPDGVADTALVYEGGRSLFGDRDQQDLTATRVSKTTWRMSGTVGDREVNIVVTCPS